MGDIEEKAWENIMHGLNMRNAIGVTNTVGTPTTARFDRCPICLENECILTLGFNQYNLGDMFTLFSYWAEHSGSILHFEIDAKAKIARCYLDRALYSEFDLNRLKLTHYFKKYKTPDNVDMSKLSHFLSGFYGMITNPHTFQPEFEKKHVGVEIINGPMWNEA